MSIEDTARRVARNERAIQGLALSVAASFWAVVGAFLALAFGAPDWGAFVTGWIGYYAILASAR